jgi:Na+/H+ antiporter NhaD/arsenite permease-like protein
MLPLPMTAAAQHSTHRNGGLGAIAWVLIGATAIIVGLLMYHRLVHPAGPPAARVMPPYWILGAVPFAGILGAIAILPLIPATHHWWESNRNRLIVALCFAATTLLYYLVFQGAGAAVHALEHAVVDEYIPFIVLLFSLYVITGGVNVQGDVPAHPITNTAILGIGALAASFVGTTGASMLLIRPLLQTNSERKHVTHTVVFFIFLVSNIGGCLLPIGDPPLFLGYLRGVPFLWTFVLWKQWAVCSLVLLTMYFIWDSIVYKREPRPNIVRDETVRKPMRLSGAINFVWLAGVVLAVWQLSPGRVLPGINLTVFPFLRELVMLGLVGMSLYTTPQGVREENRFNYTAIIEVAALFIGIFITMQVPIEVLHVKGDQLGVTTPGQFFWITGLLSSVLDNAPTYVVFFETANTMTHEPGPGIFQLVTGDFIREDMLVGISLGSVFMGANTYIGNGPNFMVKSIAEQAGVAMPSFFGYIIRYAVPVLLPLFILIWILFLR